MAIRFHESDVRVTGRASMGVIGMRFGTETDSLIAMQIKNQGKELLVVSEYGMGKKTPFDEFRIQSRGGKGIICYKTNEKTGNLVAAKLVNDETDILFITDMGQMMRTPVEGISTIGRNTSGVRIMNVNREKGEHLVSIAKAKRIEAPEIREEDEETEGE